MSSTLTGAQFEQWLFNPEHRNIPDFLDMPEVAFGNHLQRGDIHALRALAAVSKGDIHDAPTWCLAGLVRLHANGLIDRQTTPSGALYIMTPRSYAVLRHNASFRQGVRYDG